VSWGKDEWRVNADVAPERTELDSLLKQFSLSKGDPSDDILIGEEIVNEAVSTLSRFFQKKRQMY
jgi:hypothetical protein